MSYAADARDKRLSTRRDDLLLAEKNVHRAWNMYSRIMDDFVARFAHPDRIITLTFDGMYGAGISLSTPTMKVSTEMVRFLAERGLSIHETPDRQSSYMKWVFKPRGRGPYTPWNEMLQLSISGTKCQRIETTTLKEITEVTYVCD